LNYLRNKNNNNNNKLTYCFYKVVFFMGFNLFILQHNGMHKLRMLLHISA
jgi:hypothetical protein